jgi:hypothetical protein
MYFLTYETRVPELLSVDYQRQNNVASIEALGCVVEVLLRIAYVGEVRLETVSSAAARLSVSETACQHAGPRGKDAATSVPDVSTEHLCVAVSGR